MDDPLSPFIAIAAAIPLDAAANGSHQALVLFLALALGVSFLCSLLEAVLLTISHAHVEVLVDSRPRVGELLKAQKGNLDQSLGAILTLNTVAHTVGAAGVGAQVLYLYGNAWVALGSGVLTVLMLVVSEIIPKTLGAVHARRLCGFTAVAIRGLVLITYPIVVALEWISDLITRGAQEKRMTREEMVEAARIGSEEGSLVGQESMVIENLLALRRIEVDTIMTPRSVIKSLPASMTVGEAVQPPQTLRYSRIPVTGKDVDDIQGVVLRYRLQKAYGEDEFETTIGELAQPVHSVPEDMSVAQVLDEFIQRRQHLFIVVDEFGGTAGLISLEDAVETLLGVEIVDETDAVADLRQLAMERERLRQQVRQRRAN